MTPVDNVTQLPVTTDPSTEHRRSIVKDMAKQYGMEADAFEQTIRKTCMPTKDGVVIGTREEFAALLVVARHHQLNPLMREIWALPKKGGGIIPVVAVDGWLTLVNRHPQFDGMEFTFQDDDKGHPVSVTCIMHRKDRNHPTMVTEYLAECKRGTDPWKEMPRRMLRHRAMVQAARYAFGFSGIFEEDEAQTFADFTVVGETPRSSQTRSQSRTKDIPPRLEPRSETSNVETGASSTRTADARQEAGNPSDAGGADLQPPVPSGASGSAPTTSEQIEDVAFTETDAADPWDVTEVLKQAEDHLAAAKDPEHLGEIQALYQDDYDRMARTEREIFDGYMEAAENRIAKAMEAAEEAEQRAAAERAAERDRAQPPAPANDGLDDDVYEEPGIDEEIDLFAVPAMFSDLAGRSDHDLAALRAEFQGYVKRVTDQAPPGSAQRLRDWWNGMKGVRAGLKFSQPVVTTMLETLMRPAVARVGEGPANPAPASPPRTEAPRQETADSGEKLADPTNLEELETWLRVMLERATTPQEAAAAFLATQEWREQFNPDRSRWEAMRGRMQRRKAQLAQKAAE